MGPRSDNFWCATFSLPHLGRRDEVQWKVCARLSSMFGAAKGLRVVVMPQFFMNFDRKSQMAGAVRSLLVAAAHLPAFLTACLLQRVKRPR